MMDLSGTKLFTAMCVLAFAHSIPQRDLSEHVDDPFFDEKIVIPYNYGYEIKDPETANFQNKAEMMDEHGNVKGSFSVLLPDGLIYMTSYTVTEQGGYVARITKIPATFRRRRL